MSRGRSHDRQALASLTGDTLTRIHAAQLFTTFMVIQRTIRRRSPSCRLATLLLPRPFGYWGPLRVSVNKSIPAEHKCFLFAGKAP